MRSSKSIALVAFALCALAAQGQEAGQEVAVGAGDQIGTGILRVFNDKCYAVTPNHVVDGAGGIEVTDTQGRTAQASVVAPYAAADLVVLQVPSQAICVGTAWPSEATIGGTSNRLENAGANGKLVRVTGAGSIEQIPVSITGISNGQAIVVPPSSSAIARGWSGSGLYVNGDLAGILMSVDPSNGRGTVLQIDYVETILVFFHPPSNITDPFLRTIASQEFQDRLQAVVDALIANHLETLKSNSYVVHTTDRSVASYLSTLAMPGFDKPGVLDFHNRGDYDKPEKLDKHPLNLTYSQGSRTPYDNQLPQAQFDALSNAVQRAVPHTWSRNSYGHDSFNYLAQSQFNGRGMQITVTLYDSETLEIKFIPSQ